MTESAGAVMTLVASNRPPSPVSISAISAGTREKARKAAAVVISKKVIGAPALASSQAASASFSGSSPIGRPRTPIRSLKRIRCGET